MSLWELILNPWPWWISGPLIGTIPPLMLLIANKPFGVSSTLRHVCAALIPGKIPFFQYNWKKESWNLLFVAGIIIGAGISTIWLGYPKPIALSPTLVKDLQQNNIQSFNAMVPTEIFNWQNVFSFQGFLVIILGGFLIGFGTRYAGGCTSGHSITGLANLQWPSLVATICFMVGGWIVATFFVPAILKL